MVLSGAHFTKSQGCDGADVLQMLLRLTHHTEFLESCMCFWRVAIRNRMQANNEVALNQSCIT